MTEDTTKRPTITGPDGQSIQEKALDNPEGSIKLVLDALKPQFERGMVILKQDGRLRPHLWDPGWTVDAKEKPDIDLTGNSIFKIVMDTKQPYHGYVRPCPTNDRFFKKWNKGVYPQHVTALPLKTNSEVFGILLGITTTEKASTIILSSWEKVSEEISAILSKKIGTAA